MKKRLLILPLLAGLALTGCSLFGGGDKDGDSAWVFEPEFDSGTDAEKNAILRAVNDLSPCTSSSGSTLFPTATNIQFSEDEQEYIRVLNEVTVEDKTVKLTWNFPAQSTYDTKVAVDSKTDIHYIKYPGVGGAEGTITWSISRIECGSAVSTKTNANYTAKVLPGTHEFKKMTLEEIYSVSDEEKSVTVDGKTYTYPSTSNIINYEYKNSKGYSPWWKTGLPDSADNNYIFTEVFGKVVFLSEDGNWGLLANGSHIMEIYSGSELNLKAETFPELAGQYVKIKGEISHYYGNFQLSFIKSIRALSAAEKAEVAEPSMSTFNELTVAKLTDAKLAGATSKAFKQFSKDYEHNQLVSVSGTITGDKINGSSGRFTFELTVAEGLKVEIQYDYHTDKDSKVVKNALEALYSKGASVTIKGTLRVSHGIEKTLVPFNATSLKGTGVNLSIVPFDVAHLAQ